MARAAEAGGADGLSLINTITGMKIDINRQKFVLANKTGGMSGPAFTRSLSAWFIRLPSSQHSYRWNGWNHECRGCD